MHLEQIKKKAGFTLVELMVAVAIIGIMAAVAAPGFIAWLPNYRLKSAARDVYSALQNARLLAVKENTTVRVVFVDDVTPANQDSYFIWSDTNGNGVFDPPGEGRGQVNLSGYGSGVAFGFPTVPAGFVNWSGTAVAASITFSGGPPPFCTYNSNGTSGAGTVYLVNGQQHIVYAITTVTSGAAKLRKYNGIQPFNQNNWME